jgi:hypothetical protein
MTTEPTDEMVQLAVKTFLDAPGTNIVEIDAAMRAALLAAYRQGRHHSQYELCPRCSAQLAAEISEPQPGINPRQAAYDAVFAVIRQHPPRSTDGYNQAAENGRIWLAVEAALDAVVIVQLPSRTTATSPAPDPS